MSRDRNSCFYIRIDTEDELQLFCDCLNQIYPNKFHWASHKDSLKGSYPYINKEYIKNIIDPFINTLFIDMEKMILQYRNAYLRAGTEPYGHRVISIYDFVEDVNKQNLPKWLNNIVGGDKYGIYK